MSTPKKEEFNISDCLNSEYSNRGRNAFLTEGTEGNEKSKGKAAS